MKKTLKKGTLITIMLAMVFTLSACSFSFKLGDLLPSGSKELRFEFDNEDAIILSSGSKDLKLKMVDEEENTFSLTEKTNKTEISGKVIRQSAEQVVTEHATETSEILISTSTEDTRGLTWLKLVWKTGENYYYISQAPLVNPTVIFLETTSYDGLIEATNHLKYNYEAKAENLLKDGVSEPPVDYSSEPSDEESVTDIPEETPEADTKTESTPDTITYSVPSSYELFDSEDNYKYYTGPDYKYISISKFETSDDNLDYVKNSYDNAKEMSAGSASGYWYSVGDEYPTYTFQFVKDGWTYMFSSTSESDLKTTIETIK